MSAAPTKTRLVEASCDACGGSEHERRYRLERSFIVACQRCGFHYVSPRLPPEALEAKLQMWAEQDVLDEERRRIAFQEDTLEVFRGYLRELRRRGARVPGRLLEVGCATGAFLKVAREEGWAVEGVEIGRASARFAREEVGLAVHNESLFEVQLPPCGYDVVACLEVIEHLESPSRAIARMASWLKPEGLLLLSTPNFDSFYRRLYGPGWWVVNCEDEHIALFDPRSLRTMLEQHGLSLVFERIRGFDAVGMLRRLPCLCVGRAGARATAAGYYEARATREGAKRALRRLGVIGLARGALRLLEGAFSSPLSPLYGLGEQLVVIARKEAGAR